MGSLPNQPLSTFSLRKGKLSEKVQVDFLSHQERESRERGTNVHSATSHLAEMVVHIMGEAHRRKAIQV